MASLSEWWAQVATERRRSEPRSMPRYLIVVAFLVVSLALLAHVLISSRQYAVLGLAALVLSAMAFFLPPMRGGAISPGERGQEALVGESRKVRLLIASPLWRVLLLVNSALLAGLAYVLFADNQLLPGFWYWLGALLYFVATWIEIPGEGWKHYWTQKLRSSSRQTLVLILAITILAAFFRLYRLQGIPAEMTSDHAEKLLDVHDVLNGLRPIFFPRNTGREALQFYLTAGLIRFTSLGLGHTALKVGTAIFGIVTVPLTYLLGKELYGRWAGLLAAFFLSVSHWHVAITRVGLRFPFTAAFAVPALYFLLRALRENRRNHWLFAGLILGIGLHTYTAMRVVPVLFAALVLLKGLGHLPRVWKRRRAGAGAADAAVLEAKAYVANSALAATASLLAFLPLLRYMRDEPQMFWYRATSRAAGQMAPAQIWTQFWENVKDALLMFNYRGDTVPANTIPEVPELGYVAGGLFMLGIVYVLWRMVRHRERRSVFVLVMFFALLLPSILSLAYPEENPSVVRAGGAVPIVMIIAAVPLVAIGKRISQIQWVGSRWVALALVAALGALSIADNYQWYFVQYDVHIRRSIWNATEMGEVVRTFVNGGGELHNVYHVPYPHWVDTRNIAINAGDITWRNAVTDLDQIAQHKLQPGRKLYLLHPRHDTALNVLRSVYPEGVLRRYRSERPGKDFLLYFVPEDGGNASDEQGTIPPLVAKDRWIN